MLEKPKSFEKIMTLNHKRGVEAWTGMKTSKTLKTFTLIPSLGPSSLRGLLFGSFRPFLDSTPFAKLPFEFKIHHVFVECRNWKWKTKIIYFLRKFNYRNFKIRIRIWKYEVIMIITFEPRNLKIEVEVLNRTLSTWLRVSGLHVACAEF